MAKKKNRKIVDGKNQIKPKTNNTLYYIIIFIIILVVDIYLVTNLSYVMVNNPNMELLDQLMLFTDSLGTSSVSFLEMVKDPIIIKTFFEIQSKLIIVYIIIGAMILSKAMEPKEEFKGIEHGSAEWAKKEDFKRFQNSKNSIPLQDGLYLSLDDEQASNVNECIIGGSGKGKSFRKVKPDLMQMFGSYIVTDPKGELFRDTRKFLINHGYKVKVLNILDPRYSDGYNPFKYIREDRLETDVLTLVDVFMKNTTDSKKQGGDQFWDDSMKALLTAIIYYLVLEKNEDKCFERVFELVRKVSVDEETGEIDDNKTELERIFKRIQREDPFHPGLQAYDEFKLASGKTAKSILISLAVRLNIFINKDICSMTYEDEMELEKIGTEKTVIFLITPDTSETFNVLASIFYTQLFQVLFYEADFHHNGRLPLLVSIEADEFANIGEIPNFDKIISTCRSRNVRIAFILQALAQLKKLYEKSYETILANCCIFNFLGTPDPNTQEYVNKKLGKTTIYVKNRGESKSSKSYSANINGSLMARDLMTVQELNDLDNDKSIVFVSGCRPFIGKKYQTQFHPLSSEVGSSFPDGIKNNTDIHKVYEERYKVRNERLLERRKKKSISILNSLDEEREPFAFQDEDVKNYFEKFVK